MSTGRRDKPKFEVRVDIPKSPSEKVKDFVMSPVYLMQRQIEPCSVNQSVFSLILICMGAGTITIPYAFYANGLVLGTIFIFFGAALSLYTGFLIGWCAQQTGGRSYEDIAFKLYGKRGLKITSICNICTCMGFVISYVVLFRDMTPYTLQVFGASLPE